MAIIYMYFIKADLTINRSLGRSRFNVHMITFFHVQNKLLNLLEPFILKNGDVCAIILCIILWTLLKRISQGKEDERTVKKKSILLQY
jgi:hypothetical protein